MNEKSVLLLNPPGNQQYVRDYYCSKTSKSGYLYTPVDFLYIGAHLKNDFNLEFVDCIIQKIDVEELIKQLGEIRPAVIVILAGTVSWPEDFSVIKRIKSKMPEIRIIGSGDVLQEADVETLLEISGLDAILHDFSSSEIAEYCGAGKESYTSISWKDEQGCVTARAHGAAESKEFSIPVPPHDLFPLRSYSYPFVRRLPFATVLTDYACPFGCTFCMMRHLRYRYRPADNVILELDNLKQTGIRDVYFADQSFGVNRRNTTALLKMMIERDYDFGWVCFSRVDITTAEVLSLWKRAGCHTVIYGIEFGDNENLEATKKGISLEQVEQAIGYCRWNGIRVVGTFMLGEPSQTPADMDRLIDLSTRLKLDFASFNTYVPRGGDAVTSLATQNKDECFDQSGHMVKSFSSKIDTTQLEHYHRKAMRNFYLRFSYLFRRLLSIRTASEVGILMNEGSSVLKSVLASR